MNFSIVGKIFSPVVDFKIYIEQNIYHEAFKQKSVESLINFFLKLCSVDDTKEKNRKSINWNVNYSSKWDYYCQFKGSNNKNGQLRGQLVSFFEKRRNYHKD